MEEGKLSPELLAELLQQTSRHPQVIVGAEAGEDAAVVVGRDRLVVTTDPITFTEENIGIYTVAVNCNDIVAMGGQPQYLTTTVLLPPGTPVERLRTLFEELSAVCRRAGVLWVGGHTEVTSAVTRVVVSATAVGFLDREPTVTSAARPGQLLVMTKWAALEATTLIARDRPEETRRLLGEAGRREAARWLEEPGISILEEGRVLRGLELAAAHDPTEGGIATGIHEIASRSGVGVRLFAERIPVREETRRLCAHFSIDPLGSLSSGVFLFTASPEAAGEACRRLEAAGIPAAVIGEVVEGAGVRLDDGRPLPVFRRDELLKIL